MASKLSTAKITLTQILISEEHSALLRFINDDTLIYKLNMVTATMIDIINDDNADFYDLSEDIKDLRRYLKNFAKIMTSDDMLEEAHSTQDFLNLITKSLRSIK